MPAAYVFHGVRFIALDASASKFFGFAEFLAGLALMVLAWTIADVSYRFRVRTAPIPLQGITFWVVAAVGFLTLLTDLWRAEQWLVPQGHLLTPASWQALLGGLLFLTFLAWAWFAFIQPPKYGRLNAKRFIRTLYRHVLKGSPDELSIIADEIARSAQSIVRYAPDRDRAEILGIGTRRPGRKLSRAEAYANDLFLLIADKRFCRVIAKVAPGTALAFFYEVGESRKYGVQIHTFGNNIMNEAFMIRDSFIFHESEGHESGFLGYTKPLTQAMFANFSMVETIGTLLDPDFQYSSKWDADQWGAYCRIVLMTFRDYVEKGHQGHSYTLFRAMGNIDRAPSDLYQLDGIEGLSYDSTPLARLRETIKFIRDAIELLDKKEVPEGIRLRIRDKNRPRETLFDHLAGMIFETIHNAATVTSPVDTCWWVQHNAVWSEIFNFNKNQSPAGKAVKFKARRLLYHEIAEMSRFPNFKGARILGFCLNVMGLSLRPRDDYDRDSRALQRAILAWVKKHYVWLHEYNPRVAEACLVDGFTYDAERRRLVHTTPAKGLRREPYIVFLELEAPTQQGDQSIKD